MVVGWTLHALKFGRIRCQFEHCNPCKKPTENFEQRRKYRSKLWSTWLNSMADDLDLVTDWWFFLTMYGWYGVSLDGGMYSRATLALLVSCVIGTISYLLELYQVVFKYPATFEWLPLFTILGEDVPQVALSLVLGKAFEAELTPLAVLNIATSAYSALIKIGGELFLNHCYCCKFIPPEGDDDYIEMEAGSNRVSSTKCY
ncbi:hypothetical protein ACHAW6_010225 [Cyclotella cf. meneghiniana]